MGAIPSGLGGFLKGALRVVYPPQCLGCGAAVVEEDALCAGCWLDAGFITGSACGSCGVPLPDAGAGADGGGAGGLVCDDCAGVARPWSAAVAALVYDGTGRRLALALKHGDRADLAPALGRWLAAAAAALLRDGMVVVPVPVHPYRLLRRRYNQAALLAAQVARAHGLAHRPGALRRLRHTPMQDHRSVADRFANQQGAIAVAARAVPHLAGRPVLLVDDVMASGATAAAAAEALAAAGAGPVSVAVLARAVKAW